MKNPEKVNEYFISLSASPRAGSHGRPRHWSPNRGDQEATEWEATGGHRARAEIKMTRELRLKYSLTFSEFFKMSVSHNFIFLAVVQGPRLLEQLREASTINLQYVSSNSEVVGPSYDQNTANKITSAKVGMPRDHVSRPSISRLLVSFLFMNFANSLPVASGSH